MVRAVCTAKMQVGQSKEQQQKNSSDRMAKQNSKPVCLALGPGVLLAIARAKEQLGPGRWVGLVLLPAQPKDANATGTTVPAN